jgi:hypothetical protein
MDKTDKTAIRKNERKTLENMAFLSDWRQRGKRQKAENGRNGCHHGTNEVPMVRKRGEINHILALSHFFASSTK